MEDMEFAYLFCMGSQASSPRELYKYCLILTVMCDNGYGVLSAREAHFLLCLQSFY